MKKNPLDNAYASKVRLEKRGRKEFVVKTIAAKERHNELFFYRELTRAKLSKLEVFEQGGELWVEYKKNACTLDACQSTESYEALGMFMHSMHEIHFLTPLVIDARGNEKSMTWSRVIDLSLKEAARRKGFSSTMLKKVSKVIEASDIRHFNAPSSMLHCDVHPNNVLFDKSILLIDKGSLIAAGDPLYDLALIAILLPGSLYLNSKNDRHYFNAFVKGYGSDFTVDRKRFDAYVLLRCLDRWPNPFEKQIPAIVEKILCEA